MATQGRRNLLFLFPIYLLFCFIAPVYADDLTINVLPSQGGTVRPDCTLGCSYTSGTKVPLVAVPNSGYVFDKWEVDCTGSNPSVSVIMTKPTMTCNANFSFCADMPVKRGDYTFQSFREACEAEIGDNTIKILATNLQESLRLDNLGPLILKGGYICGYSNNPSFTLIQGQMFFETGTTTVENLMILSGTPPVITSFTADPSLILSGEISTLRWTVADATEVSIDKGIEFVDPIYGSLVVSPVSTTVYTMTAGNSYGTVTAQATVNVQLPEITTLKAEPDVISSGQSSKLSWEVSYATSVVIDQGIGEVDPASGFVNVSPTTTTVYTLTLTNAAGTITKKITVGVIPPDPADIAPPIDQTIATTVYDASSFLYTSPTPVQTGMAPETIEPKRVAVLRGKVLDDNGLPLAGVTVTLLNHPEYGQTITRPDGMFDMVVNGGGLMNVKYTKTGYLTVQRQRDIPWQDYMWLPEIRMIGADPYITIVDLTSQSDFQVVRGSVITDARGTRQSTVLIPKGTQALMVFPDGHEEPITSLTVRATEFTVGATGEGKMPAELPPTSAYTYCEEFTVEEAVEAGAPEVRFSRMAISYNENFLNFPVGTGIPLGAYDRERGVWIPSDNGKVIKILSITNGLAELDTDGNGTIDNGVSLGITDSERAALANLYTIGQSLWRVLVPHFTKPWDKNMGTSCEEPCGKPNMPSPFEKEPTCVNEQTGSIIQCQSQALAEDIPITGTPYSLHYQSNRVRGRADEYTISIPLTGTSISPSLRTAYLEIEVAGQKIVRTYAPATNLTDTFTWDGKDAYGRTVQGRQPITVRIGYAFKLVYTATDKFGYNGGGTVMVTQDNFFIPWQVHKGWIGPWDAKGQGLGGWTLDVHHAYDSLNKFLYLGDGGQESPEGMNLTVIDSLSGPFSPADYSDGIPASQSSMIYPQGIAVGPDGSIYIADGTIRIRRIGPDGIITTVAGFWTGAQRWGFSGDGGPATQAQLNFPADVAVGQDGSIYIADTGNNRIRRVDTNGIITTVAGSGGTGVFSCGYSGDGGPATEARLCQPDGVAVGSDGTFYIRDSGINHCIRRVATDGTISTVVGSSYNSQHLALAPDGNLYFVKNHSVLKMATDGKITTVINISGQYCPYNSPDTCGDGGPATDAKLGPSPTGVTVGPDGTLYIGDYERIRMVGTDGIIRTIAGRTVACSPYNTCGDGGPATQGEVGAKVYGLAAAQDGSLIISDYEAQRIRHVFSPLPGYTFGDILVPSGNGAQAYIFNSNGRHLRTLNALTGAIVYEFGYDGAELLISVSDGDGNITVIERDVNGNPTAVVAPFGQRTTLSLDANGYLSGISNPAGESDQFVYTSEGLLTNYIDPRNRVHQFTYDSLGLLTKDEDPAGGSVSLARTEMADGYEVTLTTGMNRITKYLLEQLPTGDEHQVNTSTDGLKTDTLIRTDGTTTTTYPDGTIVKSILGPDPRFKMQAPFMSNFKITTLGGLALEVSESQAVTLADPNNPLSLATAKAEYTINSAKYTTNYTASTKTVTEISPAGRQVTSKIDTQGRLVEYQFPGVLPFQFTYDAQGHLTSAKQGSGSDLRESTFQYNAEGFPQIATNPLLETLSLEYDQAGRVTRMVLPGGREIIYTYDADGNPTSITPPGRPAHALAFTPVGLLQSYGSPDAGAGVDTTLWTWNIDRDLTETTRPEGGVIAHNYDAAGRLSSLTYSGGSVNYGYDAGTGQLNTITGPGGVDLAFTYDGSLLTEATWSGTVTGTLQHTYDNNFRVVSQEVNGGNLITFGYDSDGLLTSAGDLVLTRNAQNGFVMGTTIGNVTETRTYNTFGETVNITTKYSGSDIFNEQFTFDKLDRIIQKVETVGGVAATYDYFYDLAGRLTEVKKNNVTASTYTYDSNDNRLSYTGTGGTVTATYDVRDRLLQYGSTTYGYSASGERLSKTNGGQMTAYTYDALGNMLQVALPGGTQVEYVLDGLGRRVGKKVNGSLVKRFLYQDDLVPVAEFDGAGVLVSRFVYGSRFNIPDYMVKGGSTYRIIADHLGSPRLVVNITTGVIEQRMEFDEFGKVILDTNPGFQPFGFAGGIYDQQTKLVQFRARDYDAEAGQWTTRDPILFLSGQVNLYAYVGNDPVNLTDPTGKQLLPWLGPLLGVCARPPIAPRITPTMRALRAMERTSNDEGLMKATEQGMKASGRKGLGQTAESAGKQTGKAAENAVDKGAKTPKGYEDSIENWEKTSGREQAKEWAKKLIPKKEYEALKLKFPWLDSVVPPVPSWPGTESGRRMRCSPFFHCVPEET